MKTKVLHIRISSDFHHEISVQAQSHNLSITDFVKSRLGITERPDNVAEQRPKISQVVTPKKEVKELTLAEVLQNNLNAPKPESVQQPSTSQRTCIEPGCGCPANEIIIHGFKAYYCNLHKPPA